MKSVYVFVWPFRFDAIHRAYTPTQTHSISPPKLFNSRKHDYNIDKTQIHILSSNGFMYIFIRSTHITNSYIKYKPKIQHNTPLSGTIFIHDELY